jgi:hypothetical protein
MRRTYFFIAAGFLLGVAPKVALTLGCVFVWLMTVGEIKSWDIGR